MRNQKQRKKKGLGNIVPFTFYLLAFSFYLLPATARAEKPVLTVVYTPENVNQWTGIRNRLQASGVQYCEVSLAQVKTMADLGERPVVLLPNAEALTPAQAIALEEWMGKGGRLIATGPVASLSAPGVRRLTQEILGGYWGFSLSEAQQLQFSKNRTQDWANKKELFGQVRGGVLVPDNSNGQAAAVWDTKDSPAAVVGTARTTFLGWRWGVDAASPQDLDTAWLKIALNRHLKTSATTPSSIQGATPTCSTLETPPPPTSSPSSPQSPSSPTPNSPLPTPNSPLPTPNSPLPTPRSSLPTPKKSDEAIDRLQDAVGFDIDPNSNAPIIPTQAILLQQELENLIGRVQSANLTAQAGAAIASNTATNNRQSVKLQTTTVATTRPEALPTNTEQNLAQNLAQAQAIAKNLPQLIAQKRFAEARRQWVMAKSILWQQFPVNQRLAQPEIRSVWLDRGTIIRAGSEQGLAKIFDRLAQSGINTIFFETLNASYTIYPSQIAPQQNPLVRGWDPLASAVKLAKERSMELHAWVWVFAAGNQAHNRVINIDPNYPGPVLAKNPDWAGYDNRGQMIPIGQGKPFFDPANPQLRQYLLKLYEEIVTRYNVDGLQLDYIRYPFQDPQRNRTYGYGRAARAQFQQLYGIDPISISPKQTDLWQKWTQFRTEQVNSFVSEVSTQLRKKRPDLILSVAVFPLPEQERVQKIQQQWEMWARKGDIDLIVPMTYATDTTRFARLAQPWIASTQLGATLLVPGMRLLNLSTVGAFDQIQLIRDLPAIGYALFAVQDFTGQLETVFGNTQGRGEAQPIPHRQPFKTAVVRYTALQQEWQFVLQNSQLKIDATNLQTFNNQSQILQKALEQLAKEPSTGRLAAAKASLFRFQSQFRTWIRSSSFDNPYQVRAWENRLMTIERLLRYGDRVQFR
ncbi:MAG: family 10 glycosylhydrolase [Scytonematopsis contorta HA4267-MV1]|nr:family 10 glycosylhydrolase [Scytonematopsis contorta HA4267-MV1]